MVKVTLSPTNTSVALATLVMSKITKLIASRLTFADLLYLSVILLKIDAFATLIEVPLLVIKNVTIKLDSPFAGKLAKDHTLSPTRLHGDPLSVDT